VNPQSLVGCKADDCPVPVACGHRDVWMRGHVDKVAIGCGGGVVVRHARCRDRAELVFDPIRCLPLPEQKIGALDHPAPLAEWDLLNEFGTLRRLMASADDQGRPTIARCRSCGF